MIPIAMLGQTKLIMTGLALVAVAGALYGAHHHIDSGGYNRAMGEIKIRDAEIAEQARAAQENAAALAASRERAYVREMDAATVRRYETEADHEKNINRLRRDADAGLTRLSVKLADSRSGCASPEAANSGLASGSGEEAKTDIMPGTASRIFGIAGGIAKLVRDYNALIDEYARARETCNAP